MAKVAIAKLDMSGHKEIEAAFAELGNFAEQSKVIKAVSRSLLRPVHTAAKRKAPKRTGLLRNQMIKVGTNKANKKRGISGSSVKLKSKDKKWYGIPVHQGWTPKQTWRSAAGNRKIVAEKGSKDVFRGRKVEGTFFIRDAFAEREKELETKFVGALFKQIEKVMNKRRAKRGN